MRWVPHLRNREKQSEFDRIFQASMRWVSQEKNYPCLQGDKAENPFTTPLTPPQDPCQPEAGLHCTIRSFSCSTSTLGSGHTMPSLIPIRAGPEPNGQRVRLTSNSAFESRDGFHAVSAPFSSHDEHSTKPKDYQVSELTVSATSKMNGPRFVAP